MVKQGVILILIVLLYDSCCQEDQEDQSDDYSDYYDLTSLDCGPDQFFQDGECYICPTCPLGSGLPSICGFGEGMSQKHVCQVCNNDTYNSLHDGRRCLPCLDCSMYNRELKFKCTSEIDSLCGECLSGYFDSYKDAIDTENLYPCTTCRMRPNEPECLLTVKGTHTTTPSVEVKQNSRQSDYQSTADKQGWQQQHPKPVGHGEAGIDSSDSVPKPSYVMGPESDNKVPRRLTKSTTEPPGGGGSDVVALAVSAAVVVLVLVIVVLIIWRARKSERMCTGSKKRRGSDDHTNEEKVQEDGGVPLEPLMTKPDVQTNTDSKTMEVFNGTVEQCKALLHSDNCDTELKKQGYCVVNIPYTQIDKTKEYNNMSQNGMPSVITIDTADNMSAMTTEDASQYSMHCTSSSEDPVLHYKSNQEDCTAHNKHLYNGTTGSNRSKVGEETVTV